MRSAFQALCVGLTVSLCVAAGPAAAHGDHDRHNSPYENRRPVETSVDAAVAAWDWWLHVRDVRVLDLDGLLALDGDRTAALHARFVACAADPAFNAEDAAGWPVPDLYCDTLHEGRDLWSLWPYQQDIPRGLGVEDVRTTADGVRAVYAGGWTGTAGRMVAHSDVIYRSTPGELPMLLPGDWLDLLHDDICEDVIVDMNEDGWTGTCYTVDDVTVDVHVTAGSIQTVMDIAVDVRS